MSDQGLITLQEAREEIQQCMKCGNCQAVCPLYAETQHEGAVARGKIRLAVEILQGTLPPSPELLDKFALCLTCKACEANCPCGVRCVDIILAARTALVNKVGLPSIKKQIFKGLKLRRFFDLGLKMGAAFQGLALKPAKGGKGRSSRFGVMGLDMRRVVPELATTPLKDGLPELNPETTGKPKMRVAFFVGCVMNYVYTDTGRAIVELLKANDVEVIVPKEQHCCGAPVYINGEQQIGREMAKHNIDVFTAADEKYRIDHVVFACGTCGGSFAEHYTHLLKGDPQYKAKAEALAEKVIDIHPLLIKVGALDKPLGRVEQKVTYHDPCHLVRGMKVSGEPRQILKAIPGIEYVEMGNAARCCGGAGSFSLTHYPLSQEITAKKAFEIKKSGADTVTTGCPACRMTIEDGLAQAEMSQDTAHPVALLYESYRCGGLLK